MTSAILIAFSFALYIGLYYFNDYNVHTIELFPAEFVLVALLSTFLIRYLLRAHNIPIHYRSLGFTTAIIFTILGGKYLLALPGIPFGSGEMKGNSYSAYYTLDIGFRDGDSETIIICRHKELRRTLGIPGSGQEPRCYVINPASQNCDGGTCDGVFASGPRSVSFSDEGAQLRFADGSTSTYSAFEQD